MLHCVQCIDCQTFRGADIKVDIANFCAAMDTLIDQDASQGEVVS